MSALTVADAVEIVSSELDAMTEEGALEREEVDGEIGAQPSVLIQIGGALRE